MDAAALALVEMALVFGGLVLFIHWQLHELRKRARARAEGRLPDERKPKD